MIESHSRISIASVFFPPYKVAISSRTKTIFVAGYLRDSSPTDSVVDQLAVLRLGVSSLPPSTEIRTISGKQIDKKCLENGSSWFSRQDSRGINLRVRSLAVNRRNDTLCICSSEGQVITFSREGVIGKIPAGDGGSEESSLDGLSAIPPVSLTTLHEAGWGNDAICVTTLRGDLGVIDPGGEEEGHWEMFHPGVLMASGEGEEGRFMVVVDMIRWLEMAGNELCLKSEVELWTVCEVSAERKYEECISRGEYGVALSLARKYQLDTDVL